MFYGIVYGMIAVATATMAILYFVKYKQNEKFQRVCSIVAKVLALTYCTFVFVSFFLPDGFALSLGSQEALDKREGWFAFSRWLNAVNFVVLPVAAFSSNKTFKKIACTYCLIISLITIGLYAKNIMYLTSQDGRGLSTLPYAGAGFKAFLINPIFRSTVFGIMCFVEVMAGVFIWFSGKVRFEFRNWKAYMVDILVTLGIFINVLPIYAMQYMVGYTGIILDQYNIVHLLWLAMIAAEIVILYFIFKKKSYETKWLVCTVLAICLFLQYNSFFQCIGSINPKRLPVQLCNIGAYLILIALLFKSRSLFNFTIIINVVGVLFAVAIPDIDGEGLGYLWNLHFLYEHQNVFVVPVLALILGVFPRLDKKALFNCLIGFCCYFVAVLIVGTIMNGVAVTTGNDYFEVNWLFMFLAKDAAKLLPGVAKLFNINWQMGNYVVYPVIQGLVLVVFLAACTGIYFFIKLCYLIHDKIYAKKMPDTEKINSRV